MTGIIGKISSRSKIVNEPLTDGGILLGSGADAITATAVLADSEMLVGDGTTDPAIESGATLRTSIGLGNVTNESKATMFTSPTFTGNFTSVGIDDNAVGATAIYIDSDEKVGIGVSDPHTTLEVNGSISCGDTQATPTGALYVRHTHASHYAAHIENVSAEKGHGLHVASNSDENDEYILNCTNGASAYVLCATGLGRVGLGTSAPLAQLHLQGTNNGTITGYGTGSQEYRECYFHGSSLDMKWDSGANEASLNAAGVWTNASDERIKKDIADIEYGLAEVLACQPRKYKMKADDLAQIGFISQEMIGIIPEVVSGGEIEENPEELSDLVTLYDGQHQYGLNYGALVAVAFKAIQELSAKVTALESA